MSKDAKKNQANNEPAAELTDEQLEDTSAGTKYGNITLKRGYIDSSELWPLRKPSDSDSTSLSETAELAQDD